MTTLTRTSSLSREGNRQGRPDADDEEKVARDKAKNEEVELDEAVTVDIEFKKDADGAAAVGSETGRKGLVVSGKKVRDKVYKMTFTNDAMMNKFMTNMKVN